MQIIVSLIVLGIALAILTAPNRFFDHAFNDGMQKLAVG